MEIKQKITEDCSLNNSQVDLEHWDGDDNFSPVFNIKRPPSSPPAASHSKVSKQSDDSPPPGQQGNGGGLGQHEDEGSKTPPTS